MDCIYAPFALAKAVAGLGGDVAGMLLALRDDLDHESHRPRSTRHGLDLHPSALTVTT
jgi:hypothetical protein